MSNNTLQILTSLLEKYSRDSIHINENTFINQIKMDSLEFLEFQMSVDEFCNIEIPVERFLECSTVKDIAQLITELKK